jgi:hypothetical protein
MISLFKKYNWLLVLSGNDPLVDVDPSDINSVAGVLKLYYRELREPLFPLHLFDELIACSSKYYYNLENAQWAYIKVAIALYSFIAVNQYKKTV